MDQSNIRKDLDVSKEIMMALGAKEFMIIVANKQIGMEAARTAQLEARIKELEAQLNPKAEGQ